MQSSPRCTAFSLAKRRRELPQRTRSRKKSKRLDAICDKPAASFLADRKLADDDVTSLRRSSRARRPPDLLDSSPVPSTRTNNLNGLHTSGGRGGEKKGKWKNDDREEARGGIGLKKRDSISKMNRLLAEEGQWKSRLRSRIDNKNNGGSTSSSKSSSRPKKISHVVSETVIETGDKDETLSLIEINCNNDLLAEKSSQVDVARVNAIEQFESEPARMLDGFEKIVGVTEENGFVNASFQVGETYHTISEEIGLLQSQVVEEHGSEDHEFNKSEKHLESPDTNTVLINGVFKDNIQENDLSLKDNDHRVYVSNEKIAGFRIKEGRRCGLCGCGTDGKPPKKLVHESFESENEAYEGSTASEEPNYNVWDGFGGEPGWLGRLLGPMNDRFGIARVWVHQHCAVWSPEVYFANLGCLKNVRAALCRGRALKCSRCGRPGATIGCRVDRCPKTYHLPCSRIEGCIFDHRKFLIACSEHRRYFQLHGNNRTLQIRKIKAKKMRLDMRKFSIEAGRKDLEAEEKWLENCGEDEEFLKREGRRLHRDILRIAPIYIGGSSENENLFPGWESVAGLEHVIQCMKEVVLLPLLYPEFFTNLCLTPPRGVLLHGYPGTGKTHVVRALIGACSRGDKKIAYFARKGADCLGKYVGDAERQLRLLFQVAERFQPSIIFFDEIDGLAPRRSRQQDQTHSSVVSTLLSLLDGLKSRGSVIVIGATNRPDAVDPALRRPGRFDREIYFPLPSEKDRSSILSLHTQSWPNPLSGSLLSWIANQTVGYAGADLQALCAQAAMHALKRNCALQQLLSSVAKGTIQGKLPCLPYFKVEERDWLGALALASPPCSQREAGIAVNDIVTSPLPAHLIPSFLLPLAHLLVSLYIDDRIWLAPMLFKASNSVKRVIVSALQQKGLSVSFWWSHLHYLVLEPFIAKQIENRLSHFGLVVGSSGSSYSIMLDGVDDESDENEKFDSFEIELSGTKLHRKLSQNCPLLVGKAIGFRTLIYGAPRSGQHHLASCLLQGFMGHEEIRKVSLSTISQEGHGDLIYGLTQILLKCLDVGRCIIFMPRIDLWALKENACTNTSEKLVDSEKCEFMTEKVNAGRKGVSEMWNSFVEQIDSAVTSASLTILATCELEKNILPHGLIRFFSSDVCSNSDTESTIPRFFLHIDGKLDLELVINSATKQLSYDLVQHYLKVMHDRTHVRHSGDVHKNQLVDVNSEAIKQNFDQAVDIPQEQVQDAISNKISIELEQIATNGESCVNVPNFHGTSIKPFPRTSGAGIAPAQPYDIQDSFSRSGKVLKGNLSLAIATFGYQILRYPQFAELIWVTSKLKEGPCTDISGTWKCWPFNTCVMHTSCSSEKGVSGANSCNVNDLVSQGVVRGLIAVGLLAYRGFYTSVSQVSADVRKVLELLVGQIRPKLFGRKDSYCNFRILSQVAYLDDMVNSWGYMLQSLQSDNNLSEVNTKPVVLGNLQSENANTGCTGVPDNQLGIQVHAKSRNIGPDISPWSFLANDGEFTNTCNELNYDELTNSAAGKTSHVQHTFWQPSIASKELTNGCEPSGSEVPLANQRLNTIDQIPDLTASENTNNEHLGDVSRFNLQNNDLSQVSCLYNCCSNCMHMVNVLSRKMISGYFKSDACYSLDDAHDIITTCSLNILTSFKQYCISRSTADLEEICERKLNCQTHPEEDHDDVLKGNLCHCIVSEMELLPADCDCHARKGDDTASADAGSESPNESKLTYFFREGVLVPLAPYNDSELHCKFMKLCVCPIVRMLQTIEQTSVQ